MDQDTNSGWNPYRVYTKIVQLINFFLAKTDGIWDTKDMNITNKTAIIVISGIAYTVGLAFFYMAQL
jgi:hypothetical protein